MYFCAPSHQILMMPIVRHVVYRDFDVWRHAVILPGVVHGSEYPTRMFGVALGTQEDVDGPTLVC